MSKFVKGTKVRLKSFNNTIQPPSNIKNNENYWKLIGTTGRIISNEKKTHPAFPAMGARVLVQFDVDVLNYDLECHNEPAENALWLFLSDLQEIE